MNTLFSRLRKSVALFSVAALLSTLVVVAPASAAWYDAAVAALGDPSYQTMSASEKEAALSRNMSRQDAAVVLHRALGSPMAATMTMETLPFTDKAEIAAYAVNAVLFHTEEGLLQGNPDGTLRPEAGLNRAELVVILDRAGVLGEEMATMTAAQEAEFVGAEWARAAFARAVASGVVQGYPDGTLRPAGPVNAAETFVLAYRAFVAPAEPTEPTEPTEEGEEYDFTSPLQGDAGTLNVVRRSAGVENEVREGANDTVVLGFEVEAKDSDVRLQNVRLMFEHTGDGSQRMERYMRDVSVWQGDREVGRAGVSEFSRTRDGGSDIYSRQVPLSNAVVRQDDRILFYVAVSAVSNIDSNDLDESWEVELDTVRFEDASGVVTTSAPANTVENDFIFEDLLGSGDTELRFSRNANNPEATAIEVNNTGTTSDVTVLAFDLRTRDSAITVDELAFDVTVVDPSGTATEATEVIDRVTLVYNGNAIQSEDAPSGGMDGLVRFTDLEDTLALASNSTSNFEIRLRFRGLDGRYGSGTTVEVEASVDEDDIYAENANGDRLRDNQLRGSAASEVHTLFVDGIQAVRTDSSAIAVTRDELPDRGEFKVMFKVTAFGEDVYLPRTSALLDDPWLGDPIYTVTGAVDNETANLTSSNAKVVGSYFEVREGETRSFTFNVSALADDNSFAELELLQIPFRLVSDSGTQSNFTSNMNQFRSGTVFLEDPTP